MAVTVADNSDGAVFFDVGTTGSGGDPHGYLGGQRYFAPNGGAGHYRFVLGGLTAGVALQVSMTWVVSGTVASNTPWFIYDSDNTTLLASGRIDQSVNPTDRVYDGSIWDDLAIVTPSGTSLNVWLSDDANNYPLADAVMSDLADSTSPTSTADPRRFPRSSPPRFPW
jgi:hypothetical protein